jgi:uncharacterized membrane protein (UPF0136 family)
MITQVYYYLFGLLAIFGGAMGFARAKSRASLIAGGISGGFLIIAGLLYPNLFGSIIALVVSVSLPEPSSGPSARPRSSSPSKAIAGFYGSCETVAVAVLFDRLGPLGPPLPRPAPGPA